MALQRILGLTLCAIVLGACTKEIPYKYQTKPETLSKALTSTSDEYLYSSSMQNASRTSADALPFSTGDNKRVKLEWTKTSLRILEMEKDSRFQGNQTNNKLVLEIPVDHVDYKCAEDKYGECTNSEVEDSDKDWTQKNSFKVKFEAVKSGELDLLPIMISQTVGENCYQEISSRLISYEVTKDTLNFQIERTYKTNLECLGSDASIDDAAVSAIFHYSMVKVNSVLSKGFQTVAYPHLDENTFGFFSTQTTALQVDNNRTEDGKTLIMNHWNPDRTEIVYYLSDEFNKPENKTVKELTRKTIDLLNQGLAQANVKFRVNLKDPAGKIPGDIRNSMIVLVEDPVASSVIGYGPQTEDPVTGEIISARTVMFLGTIKKFVKYTYEEILRTKKQDLLKALAQAKQPVPVSSADVVDENGGLIIENGAIGGNGQRKAAVSRLAVANRLQMKTQMIKAIHGQKISKLGLGKAGNGQRVDSIVAQQITKEFKQSYTKNVNREFISMDRKTQLKYMLEAKNCAFSPSADMIGSGISDALKARLNDFTKPWEQLSDKEKQAVIDIILPEIWVPTLIHELGHNMGLRHNFQASEDKANYFSDDELSQLKIDHKAPFSSVMDYGNDLKTLPVLGKYDIAALKFGYLRTVETKDGKTVSVKDSLDKMTASGGLSELKVYGYCTDEHVGANAGCKRFDEGSSYTEITANLIKDYTDAYTLRNFRRNRENMSLYDDTVYAARINSTFSDIRSMFETYERIVNRFQIPTDDPIWETNEFLKDIKAATILGGQFFAQILLTPDVKCAVVADANPGQIVALASLKQLGSPDALSCAEVQKLDGYTVVGQTGKFINSLKDPKSNNAYLDQIDIRGIWLDKMMAAQNLFARQVGNASFDKYSDNYMDVPELQKLLVNTVLSLEMNEVAGPMELTLNTGETLVIEAPYDVLDDHLIAQVIHPVIARRLGIPFREMYLQEKIGQIVATEMVNGVARQTTGAPFSQALKVTKFKKPFIPTDAQTIAGLLKIDLGADVFFASEDNIVAAQAIQGIQIGSILGTIAPEKLAEIIKARDGGTTAVPADATPAEKVAWSLPVDILKGFAAGQIQSPANLEKILRYLPSNI